MSKQTKNKWVMVSYYTEPYEKYVGAFIEACNELDIECYVMKKECSGNWYDNVKMKLTFIRSMMRHRPYNDIVWCDIDAKVVKYPEKFDEVKGDFAAYRYSILRKHEAWIKNMYGFLPDYIYFTGTMYFKNRPSVRKWLDKWIKLHEEHIFAERPTQKSLYILMQDKDKMKDIAVEELPETYCYIVKRGKNDPDRVIEHYCASNTPELKELREKP